MKPVLSVFIFLLGLNAHAEVGFKNGNQKTAVLAQGRIVVHCQSSSPGGPTYGSFNCREEILTSGEYDYFVGPADTKGDSVTLTALHQDGSQRTKTVAYDSNKGQSKKSINLWIATLLQRPLLDPGKNTVRYKITLNDKVTASGEFIAEVKDGGTKTCSRTGSYWSNNSSDCQNGTSMCRRYFNENNYCL
ncbi:hypothetical protein EZJ49_02030 [Bdellovibrio bacteriovorus]|uniref:hypothetical protein n=1 Tax=Bdellovibrio bacteriovorus TaxID=959 RepID=UPI0021D14ACC|nr:hypothetical protein [Bdellovibrio bacteriovorus]UXR65027.1 hypothetical protein EZJ49_02030 [Bdellovibrio bacteriovorus]